MIDLKEIKNKIVTKNNLYCLIVILIIFFLDRYTKLLILDNFSENTYYLNDYINCNMDGWCARITEGDTKLEIKNNTSSNKDGFIINEQSDETIDFV